ncbi:hypothetical protein [Streptomyces pseudogriseolus]|uniref:hypothetical protein n=1 Tax=Streptomyces pseudogriseolus TaxID=36817 RepID=UPI003FA1C75E
MTIAVNDVQVLSTLLDVVSEKPEHVYEPPAPMRDDLMSCFYVHRDEDGTELPGCIVGQVLNRLGVELDRLKELEGLGASSVIDQTTEGVSYAVKTFLRDVQRKQDRGRTWIESVRQALDDYNAIYGTKLTLPESA